MVSPNPEERAELTALIRQELRRGSAPSSPVLAEKPGNRLRAESYAAGDIIHYKSGSAELGIAAGSRATVREVNPKANLITVDTGAGDPYTFADDLAEDIADENEQCSAEEVLLSTIDNTTDDRLTRFAIRLALSGHVGIPREGEFDFLTEAEAVFTPPVKRSRIGRSGKTSDMPVETAKPKTQAKKTPKEIPERKSASPAPAHFPGKPLRP